jgi:hypothetical protein
MEVSKGAMTFLLTGVRAVAGFRVFAFEGIAADYTRSAFTIRADLVLVRRYGIHIQELPLLCRSALERCVGDEAKREFIYTEEDMRVHADKVTAQDEALKMRRASRRRPTRPFAIGRTRPLTFGTDRRI